MAGPIGLWQTVEQGVEQGVDGGEPLGGDIPDLGHRLDEGAGNEFVPAVGQQVLHRFRGRFQVELQAQDAVVVEKGLLIAGLALGQMGGP